MPRFAQSKSGMPLWHKLSITSKPNIHGAYFDYCL
jgi:hypothetical protein